MRLRVAAMLLLLPSMIARAQDAEYPVSFRLHDRVASAELTEVTSIYVDGRLIGAFRLGPDRPEATLTARVGRASTHTYALCGHIVLRGSDGVDLPRDFNVSGTIEDVEGRDFEAVASDGFNDFYLVDTTPDRAPAAIVPSRAPGCSPATS